MIYIESQPKIERTRDSPALLDSFEEFKEGISIDPVKEAFIRKLAHKLPRNAFPYMETDDGSVIDIYWEDRLMITIDIDCICVSDYSSGKQEYQSFDTFGDDAIEHIYECYGRLQLTPDDLKE